MFQANFFHLHFHPLIVCKQVLTSIKCCVNKSILGGQLLTRVQALLPTGGLRALAQHNQITWECEQYFEDSAAKLELKCEKCFEVLLCSCLRVNCPLGRNNYNGAARVIAA